MVDATPQVADRPRPPKRRRRWLTWLILLLALALFAGEAYVLSPTVRVGVVETLGCVGPPAAPLLFDFCQDREGEVQAAAVQVLIHSGPKAVPAVQQALADPDAGRRELAAQILGAMGPAAVAAVPALAAASAKDQEGKVRKAATAALGGVRGGGDDPAIAEALLTPLKDADPEVRMAALQSLHNLGPAAKVAVPFLVQLLKNDDTQVRLNAVECLGDVGPDAREAIPALQEELKDPVKKVRSEAAEALEEIDQSPDKN